MSDQSIPPPQYTLWECVNVAIVVAKRALEEVRALSRIPGPEGKEGPQGKTGERGDAGPEGPIGPTGHEGRKGDPGTPGRDGLGFDAIEKIDEEKEYGFKFVLSGAVVREFRFTKPTANIADAYKRVWKEGEYKRGDVVTFGGSAFLAMRDTSDKPEASDAWVLWVKRGRDGKNGDNGKPGPAGPRGEKGDRGDRGYSG